MKPQLSREWSIGDQATIEHSFSSADVYAFVELCGDDNPLHVDENSARRSLAGGRVVHGMLTASWISTLIGTKIPGPGALWNRFSIDWKRMVRIDDKLVFQAEVVALKGESMELSVVATRGNETVLCAEARVSLMEGFSQERDEESPRQGVVTHGSANRTVDSAGIRTQSTSISEKQQHQPWQPSPQGKTLLITGATGAIGTALLKLLVQKRERFQHHVLIWGRDRNQLKELSGMSDHIHHQEVDLEDPLDVKAALSSWPRQEPCAGVVHVAAAPWRSVSVDDAEVLQEAEKHMQVGYLSYVAICQHLSPMMCSPCSLVALSSQFALEAPPEHCGAYIGAKLALEGYCRSCAVELGPRGIRSNLIAPSMINTPYVRDLTVRRKMVEAARNPLRRLCSVEDVAESIAWLISEKSAFVNGTTLPLTGGLTP